VGDLVLRMVLSLCIVLGLLLVAARVAGKRYQAHGGSTVKVLQRQALSRGSTVTVVSVGTRVLVLGTTEQQVRVLTELRPDEVDLPADAADPAHRGVPSAEETEPGRLYAVPPTSGDFAQVLLEAQDSGAAPLAPRREAAPGRHAARHRAQAEPATPAGALGGSLLSPQTWRQALQAVSGRAS
jgi:flagellar protein FliO/FliZ